jgi:hypothetical protein
MMMDWSYSEEGGENIAKQALGGIHREPGRPKQTWKKTVSEETGKCCKIWSAVKMMADTRDRWRCFTNVLVSNGTKGYTAAAALTTATTTTTT